MQYDYTVSHPMYAIPQFGTMIHTQHKRIISYRSPSKSERTFCCRIHTLPAKINPTLPADIVRFVCTSCMLTYTRYSCFFVRKFLRGKGRFMYGENTQHGYLSHGKTCVTLCAENRTDKCTLKKCNQASKSACIFCTV